MFEAEQVHGRMIKFALAMNDAAKTIIKQHNMSVWAVHFEYRWEGDHESAKISLGYLSNPGLA